MADYCLQCNIDLRFGLYSDFAHYGERGQITEEEAGRGLGILTLCEGCGPIIVDHKGRCTSNDCYRNGHTDPASRERLWRAEKWLRVREGPLGSLYRLRDRLLGTPWDPGLVREWRWRWNDWRAGKKDDEEFWGNPPNPPRIGCSCRGECHEPGCELVL